MVNVVEEKMKAEGKKWDEIKDNPIPSCRDVNRSWVKDEYLTSGD